MKTEYAFQGYLECSAKTRDNLTAVFYTAVKLHYDVKKVMDATANNAGAAGAGAASGNQAQLKGQVKEKDGWCSVL